MIQSVAQQPVGVRPVLATGRDNRPVICHVIHSLGVGGAEVLLDQMVRRMSDEFRFVVAVLDEVGEIGERLRRDGVTVHHLHREPGIDRNCAQRLKAFADQQQVSILHAHQYTPFFQAMLSRGLVGRRPVVFTEHGRHVPDLPSRKRMIVNRLLLRKRDRLIGVGEAVADALIKNEGLPAQRVEVIYNGVDLNRYQHTDASARELIRAEFGFNSTDFVAVQVARLHDLKDHETAIRAMKVVCEEVPHARLLIVGDGDCRSRIEQLIEENQLEFNVVMAGARNDVPDLLAASDLFLMTSISEGIPLTLIEAMAAGLPVVSTAVGGIPEMIESGVSGYLHEARDVGGIAASVISLTRDLEQRHRISVNGRKTALEKFSLETMLLQYRQVYRDVAGVAI
ncbi:MAG: glycosyltransferase [Planctomyces sp.]|nr:glycosyltransferase [Planctomyces sp.]